MRSVPEPLGVGPTENDDGPVRATISREKTNTRNATGLSDRRQERGA